MKNYKVVIETNSGILEQHITASDMEQAFYHVHNLFKFTESMLKVTINEIK